jgi:hypothetical protein
VDPVTDQSLLRKASSDLPNKNLFRFQEVKVDGLPNKIDLIPSQLYMRNVNRCLVVWQSRKLPALQAESALARKKRNVAVHLCSQFDLNQFR